MTSHPSSEDVPTPVFRWRARQPVVWFDWRPERSNHWCPYCMAYVGPGSDVESDCEHLIGKRFVPKGTLRGDSFNFLFRACCACNRRKSAAEDHVSSVTLFNGPARETDKSVDEIARHKATRSIHPVERGPNGERVPVQDAFVDHRLHGELMPGVRMTVNLVGPPQLHDPTAHFLARRHVQGFFTLITSADPTSAETTRVLPEAECFVYRAYPHQDWGNAELRALTHRTATWNVLAQTTTADGFFRAKFLRIGGSGTEWFWALEWNRAMRVVGSLTRPGDVPALFADLVEARRQRARGGWHFSEEVPLAPEDDTLFRWDGEAV